MSEIAKCRCGAAADAPEADRGDYYRIECLGECDFYVSAPTIEGVVSVWNSLMRPRPVAEWGAPAVVTYLYVGRAVLGYVLTSQSGGESAVFGITGELFRGHDARAWLVARVRAAGLEVREEVSDE